MSTAREQSINPIDDNIINDILRNFAPKVLAGMGPHDGTEDEYAAAEILEQEGRERDFAVLQRVMGRDK